MKLKQKPAYFAAWTANAPARIENFSSCGRFAQVVFYGKFLDFPFYIPLANLQPGHPPPETN